MVEVMTFFFFLYGFSHPRHHHCESFFFLLFFSTFFFFRTVQTPPPLPTTPPGKRNTASLHRRHDVVFMYRCVQSPRGYRLYSIRPFLMQSDSASRKRPFSTGLFFDWNFLVLLLVVSRVDFIVFVLFLEAVGVREYCCTQQSKSVGSSVLRASSASNGSANPRPQRVGGFGLSRKPPKLRSWSCTQPRAAKATAAAAVVGSMGSRPRGAAVV